MLGLRWRHRYMILSQHSTGHVLSHGRIIAKHPAHDICSGEFPAQAARFTKITSSDRKYFKINTIAETISMVSWYSSSTNTRIP